MNVLVVAAHPDDEVLGCGGTIARLSGRGDEIHIAILGEGITSRYDRRGEADAVLMEALHERAQAAGDLLGSASVELLGLPDNRFDTLPLLDVVKVVEELVERLDPQVVYTHHPGDLNIDHLVTFRAVLTATRPFESKVRDVYAFEIPSSTEWAFQQLQPPFRPNVFVDIEETLEVKLAAMEQYESEARDVPHPRSSDVLRSIARRWGAVVGRPYAEAFELIRAVRD